MNGGDTCPEPPHNNLKRQKDNKMRKGKKKRENTKHLERVFYCKHGETTPRVVGRTLKISIENSGSAAEKDNPVCMGDDCR